MEYISPAPAGYSAPAALVEYVSPAPTVSIAEPAPTVYAAHATVVEYISQATALSFAAPAQVQYATPVKHAQDDCEWSRFEQGWHFICTSATSSGYLAPVQHGAPVQYGGPLSYAPVLKNTWIVTRVDTILLAYENVVRTLRCPLSTLMRWRQGRCAALPSGLCDRRRETRGFSKCYLSLESGARQ